MAAAVLVIYTVSIFLSSFLLFLVQPIVGKMILPTVGGAATAWNICMLFFQAVLLAGYFWTHLSVSKLGSRRQLFLQFPLLLAALAFLPVGFAGTAPAGANPSLWLFVKLCRHVGLPFLAVAGISPLLQIWFAQTAHRRAGNPYFLYAASNAGSVAGLLAYPFALEPFLDLQAQGRLWTAGYALLLVCLAACAFFVQNTAKPGTLCPPGDDSDASQPPARGQVLLWVVAAFVPSSLLLAVTQYLTVDLAPIPLLWVIPLLLYLVSFIIAFAERQWLSARAIRNLAALAVVLALPFYLQNSGKLLWPAMAAHLFALFAISLFCHRFVAASKPAVCHLTAYYAWISVGGVMGGIFNSLVAPELFTERYEHPLMLIIAAVLIGALSFAGEAGRDKPRLPVWGAALAGLYVAMAIQLTRVIAIATLARQAAIFYAFDTSGGPTAALLAWIEGHEQFLKPLLAALVALAPAALLWRHFRLNLGVLAAAALLPLTIFAVSGRTVVYRTRNFYGIKHVAAENQGQFRLLLHGSTVHGSQILKDALRRQPLRYYHPKGPAGDIFALPLAAKPDLQVGIIGLGIGSMVAYAKPGQQFVFYEIDPDVARIAGDELFFTHLSDFKDNHRIVIGDGRLKIAEAPKGCFDIIILDAFSSDSIPVHLLTLEAMRTYLERLRPDGIIVFHISNRYLDLHPVISAAARELGLHAGFRNDFNFNSHAQENTERGQSQYAFATPSAAIAASLFRKPQEPWSAFPEEKQAPAWTDGYSSLLPLLKK